MKHVTSLVLLSAIVLAAGSAVFGAADEPIQPITPAVVSQPALVELGKKLFFDPRLSKSGFISCNSCHNLSMGGSDNLKTSIGDRWHQGPINAPTVLNSSLSVAQFWDGRAKNLQDQAGGPIANPGEMGYTHELTVAMLSSIPQYVTEFTTAFGAGPIDIGRATSAIAAFEETLVTPNAPFDKWLKGDAHAISADAVAGYQLFKASGCTSCHNGPAAGGAAFRKMGVVTAYRTDNPSSGRQGVTGKDADRFTFKVPTLRNVALTYPYFHDGAANTLPEAVDVMGRVQLGRQFTAEENIRIVRFLQTLTGDQPTFALPQLPPSADGTPRPRPFE
ncbi:MAG: cytochrome-c peroxidase [Vicinamibacterales bacterium]